MCRCVAQVTGDRSRWKQDVPAHSLSVILPPLEFKSHPCWNADMLTCWGFSLSVSSLWSLLWIKWFWSFSLKESLYLIIEAPLSCCHKYDAFSFFPQSPACGHHACMLSCGRDTGWTYKEHVHLSLPVRPSPNHSLNSCSTIYYLLETLSNLNEDVIPVSENTHSNHWSQQWGVHHFCYGVWGILLP